MPDRRRDIPAAYALRIASHEAGHAVLMWISYLPGEISASMPMGDKRSALTRVAASDNRWLGLMDRFRNALLPDGHERHARDLWERAVCAVGGLAGEGVTMGTVLSAGSDTDLMLALDHAGRIVKEGLAEAAPWPIPELETKIDVARMYVTPPAMETASVLNAAYRRARAEIKAREDAFNRITIALLRDWRVGHRKLMDILGPRP